MAYTHCPTPLCNKSCKPFPKTQQKIVTVTIEDTGDLRFLATDSADIFLELGETVKRRASHVEPASFLPRQLFHLLRLFGDKNEIAAWTRTWKCLWRVNTSPVGGPILTWCDVMHDGTCENHTTKRCDTATWRDRQSAIDAEIKFLNHWFTQRGI